MRAARLNAPDLLARSCPQRGAAVALVLITQFPCAVQCQITPNQASAIRAGIENRVEALTILGGDFGLSDGRFKSRASLPAVEASADVVSNMTKGGGFQWIGVGASYLWGPNITGWTVGADVAFRF